ncbi:MAG: hypothetical protein HRT91_04075 [Piscirickettsiaceae bacterium]|nr:hypothetical protein [Piscirickettsiaceae bacterium]
MDETYINITCKWFYHYRAPANKFGYVVDYYLNLKRGRI